MNTPKIRFKGFTDDWEQRKLGELCNITTGKLDANAMVSDGQYDFYTSGIDVFKIDVAAFEGPAITIAGNGASVGYMHLADGKFNAYQRTYVLTDFLADRQFLNVAIGNELPNKIQEEVRGSGIPYIVLNMLTDLAIPFPSHEEQYAIGVYFQQLDHLITLHQRKCDETKQLKKFMLQKMFPKNGEKNPEIRFKGFTDDWEQRKVGEVTKELLDYDNFSSGLPLLTSSRSGLMYQSEYRGNATTENENTLFSVVPLNACTYRHMSDDSTFHLNINTLEKGLVSKEYPVFQENESNLKFIVQYINSSNSFTKFCTEQKKGGTRTRLYYKTLCEYKLMMPSIKEQNKTANFFDTLDHLITLHQRKCEKLKELKKFMLQNMFV